jgi:hypothetical protein
MEFVAAVGKAGAAIGTEVFTPPQKSLDSIFTSPVVLEGVISKQWLT